MFSVNRDISLGMISIKEARKILGKDSDKYTDRQVREIVNFIYRLSVILVDQVLKKELV